MQHPGKHGAISKPRHPRRNLSAGFTFAWEFTWRTFLMCRVETFPTPAFANGRASAECDAVRNLGEIRKIVYSTNAVESLHMTLRKVTRNRGSFQPRRPPSSCSTWRCRTYRRSGTPARAGARQCVSSASAGPNECNSASAAKAHLPMEERTAFTRNPRHILSKLSQPSTAISCNGSTAQDTPFASRFSLDSHFSSSSSRGSLRVLRTLSACRIDTSLDTSSFKSQAIAAYRSRSLSAALSSKPAPAQSPDRRVARSHPRRSALSPIPAPL